MLRNAKVNLKFTQDRRLVLPDREEIRSYFAHDASNSQDFTIDNDDDWQMRWLGQILEDLFGLRELGTDHVDFAGDALRRGYEVWKEGDPKHPSPHMRLQIAEKYLEDKPANILQTIAQETDETTKLAILIANHLRTSDLRPSVAPGSPTPALSSWSSSESKTRSMPGSESYVLEKLKGDPAILAAFTEFKSGSVTGVEESDQIWIQAGFTGFEHSPEMLATLCDGKTEIQALLEKLQRIQFTETDESGPGPVGQHHNSASCDSLHKGSKRWWARSVLIFPCQEARERFGISPIPWCFGGCTGSQLLLALLCAAF